MSFSSIAAAAPTNNLAISDVTAGGTWQAVRSCFEQWCHGGQLLQIWCISNSDRAAPVSAIFSPCKDLSSMGDRGSPLPWSVPDSVSKTGTHPVAC